MNIITIIKEEIENLRYALAGYGHDEKQKSHNETFHVTSIEKGNEILKVGFMKNKPSNQEPEAIYLTPDIYGAVLLSKSLSDEKRIKTDWIILKINSRNLTLFKDPYSIKEHGVYTYDTIPKDLISIETIVDAMIIKNNKNWKQFMNWWLWKTNPKPEFVQKFTLNPISYVGN